MTVKPMSSDSTLLQTTLLSYFFTSSDPQYQNMDKFEKCTYENIKSRTTFIFIIAEYA